MLPQPALDLIGEAYPSATIGAPAPTFGGFSHHAARLMIGDLACVVKAADDPIRRADLRREASTLQLLRASELPVPQMIRLIDARGWTVEVQQAIGGAHGLDVLARPPAEQAAMYRALGGALAALHRTNRARPTGADWLLAERFGRVRDALPTLGIDAALRDELRDGLDHPAWRPPAPGLVHGDAGAHNLLWEGRITALLDWEWAGWGPPLLDLAWVYWTMRWRSVADEAWPAFLAGYGRTPQPEQGALRALALGQIAGLLARSQGRRDAWEEWLRRARWTLAQAFPD